MTLRQSALFGKVTKLANKSVRLTGGVVKQVMS